jgi:CheY-like chemotaxis protein
MSFHILIVNDQRITAEFLAEFLNDAGFTDIAITTTIDETIEYVEKNKPDLVFLKQAIDMESSRIDDELKGMGVLRRIRRTTPESQVCVLMGTLEEHGAEITALGAYWVVLTAKFFDNCTDIAHKLAAQKAERGVTSDS